MHIYVYILQQGDGHLFSIDIVDAAGTEIRGTFFKDACDKFQPMIETGKVYFKYLFIYMYIYIYEFRCI
jgi:hypothetical protein